MRSTRLVGFFAALCFLALGPTVYALVCKQGTDEHAADKPTENGEYCYFTPDDACNQSSIARFDIKLPDSGIFGDHCTYGKKPGCYCTSDRCNTNLNILKKIWDKTMQKDAQNNKTKEEEDMITCMENYLTMKAQSLKPGSVMGGQHSGQPAGGGGSSTTAAGDGSSTGAAPAGNGGGTGTAASAGDGGSSDIGGGGGTGTAASAVDGGGTGTAASAGDGGGTGTTASAGDGDGTGTATAAGNGDGTGTATWAGDGETSLSPAGDSTNDPAAAQQDPKAGKKTKKGAFDDNFWLIFTILAIVAAILILIIIILIIVGCNTNRKLKAASR
ncbi:hypothetical protein Q1695_015131 [Nippostrongylus brasiliensis]|nr:hypothetical protein Q1695_015131 [Nippostrongylus brasiliensis]